MNDIDQAIEATIGDMGREIKKLQEENDRLRAIVGKLRTYADTGEPILPGDRVFWTTSSGCVSCKTYYAYETLGVFYQLRDNAEAALAAKEKKP